jgi:CBS domain-containing protein
MAVPKLVREIMTVQVSTIEHDAKLLDAVLLLRSSGFRHLPVVKEGRLAGLLSDRDVQRAAPSLFGECSRRIQPYL